MKISLLTCFAALASVVVFSGAGCGSSSNDSGFTGSSGGSGGGSGSGGSSDAGKGGDGTVGTIDPDSGYGILPMDGSAPPMPVVDAGVGCANLQCNIDTCEGGAPTSITGTVYDPAGNNPLYNVVVFIPNTKGGALPLIPRGVNTSSCSCGDLFQGEEPIVDTLTDAAGKFTLTNVPSGTNIPVVVQIGKWRKEIVVPSVTSCKATDAGKITLPKNGSDGLFASLPNIAVSTGQADSLECLLTRIGIDEKEFSGDPGAAGAHVHVFQGGTGTMLGAGLAAANPASPLSGTALWDTAAHLEQYDITMLSCEGSTDSTANPQAVSDYVSAGGRLFAEHFHYDFFANQPQFANTASWAPGGAYTGAITGQVQTTLANGMAFPEGQALQTWLTNVGALTNNLLPIAVARQDATVAAGNLATAWVASGPGITPASTQYFSWDMPFNPKVDDAGVPEYCGRVVFSDLHVAGSNGTVSAGGGPDYTPALGQTVPTGCASTNKLSADEDALEFIFFDLSSCVTPIGYPPKPPPPQPKPEAGIQ